MDASSLNPTRRALLGLGVTTAIGVIAWQTSAAPPAEAEAVASFRLTDAEWRKRLRPSAYEVLREASTEYPYSSPLNAEHREGTFVCAGCALPLFASATKFDSGTGWPSFYDHLPHAIGEKVDAGLGMQRTEVHCARCAGHLGHVFNDGPRPTGLRYCMNGVAMQFKVAASA
jgi:peptide-methionine (R)-S-oxide reductase